MCRLCSTGAVEDELHILTTCPALAALRAGCPGLQREHTNLASVFANCELRQLGWLACQAIQEHSRLLEVMNQPLWPAGYVPQSNYRTGPASGVGDTSRITISQAVPSHTRPGDPALL